MNFRKAFSAFLIKSNSRFRKVLSRNFWVLLLTAIFFTSNKANAQLSKWLVDDLIGNLYLVDFTQANPTSTLVSNGGGSGGTEDINIMTDSDGNVMFSTLANSTSNVKVMDKYYQTMPNGNGLNGNNSSMQSNIIPKPCDSNQFYIVHFGATTHKLYYSVVDMSSNGGLGDVISKNNLIGTGQCEAFSCSHQLATGCRWLFTTQISGNSYNVVRYLVSDAGIGSGITLATVSFPSAPPYYDDLQLSANNSKLAISTVQSSSNQPDLIVWDLDLSSGSISNQQSYNVNNLEPVFTIEFSPDGNKLYYRTNSSGSDEQLGRLNLLTGLDTTVASNLAEYQSHIETAGNGKIYMTNIYSDYLAVIDDPDNANVSNVGYNGSGVYVSGSGLLPGLPHAIQGEPPGTTSTPSYIAFSATPVLCNEFQFADTTCLASWWHWDFGDGTSSNLEFPSHQFLNADTFDVTLKIAQCADTLSLTHAVIATGGASVTITQSNDTLFSSLGNTYQWYSGGNTISGATNSFYVPPAEGEYAVVISDNAGCSAIDSIYFSLTPIANFSVPDQTICEKFCLDFFDQSTGNPTSWQWIFEGGIPSSSAQQNPTQICYNLPGFYDVTLITTNAFGSDTLLLPNYITVFPTPSFPIITQNGYTLTSSFAYTYQWQFNAADIPGATNQSYTATQTGFYTVIITDENGCANSTTIYVEITGIDEMTDGGIFIYPNPCNGKFLIDWKQGRPGDKISLSILNPLGEEVYAIADVISSPDFKEVLNLKLAEGVYFLRINSESKFYVAKILVKL